MIIDGVKEQGAKKTKALISSLLSDLDIDFNDQDIKNAYRVGPFKKGVARPRSIKVEFATRSTKGEICKNIGKNENPRSMERYVFIRRTFFIGTSKKKKSDVSLQQ